MNTIAEFFQRVFRGSFMPAVLLVAQAAIAVPTVDMTVTPLAAGLFQYQFSISNSGPEDIAIVSITDAPVADPLIAATLVAPTGFFANYDPGIGLTFGFVDFLEDTSLFQAGTTTSGFRFQSASSPAANFQLFEALSVDGDFFQGNINRVSNAVPEGGGTGVLAGVALLALIVVRNRVWSLQS